MATDDMELSRRMYVESLTLLAESLRRAGLLSEARECAERALCAVRELGDRSMAPDTLHVLASVCSDMREQSRAHVLAWRAFTACASVTAVHSR